MIKYSAVLFDSISEPVTVDEIKAQLYITNDDRDTVLEALRGVARHMCERYAGLSFMTQTRVVKLDYFGEYLRTSIELPYGPIIAISGNDAAATPNALGVSYLNEDGDTVELTLNTDYILDSHSHIPRLSPVEGWPTTYDSDRIHPITITYTAGYTSAALVPPEAKQAIITQVAYMHENPDAAGGLCIAAQDILDFIKVYFYAG